MTWVLLNTIFFFNCVQNIYQANIIIGIRSAWAKNKNNENNQFHIKKSHNVTKVYTTIGVEKFI